MPKKSKLQAANLDGDADEIEAAFYDALQNGDLEKLMACWADEDEIVCIHPGGPREGGAAGTDDLRVAGARAGRRDAPGAPGAAFARPAAARATAAPAVAGGYSHSTQPATGPARTSTVSHSRNMSAHDTKRTGNTCP